MTKPRISIVLPVYNGSRYLAGAIESCLTQTFADWELIIVDDASMDETPAIITRYSSLDSRVRAVRHETNRKLPSALNTGFALARGEFFTWTSDDNLYRREALAALHDFLVAAPDADIVYADYTVIDTFASSVLKILSPDPVYVMRENVVGPVFLYRRKVHDHVGGYREDMFLVEDYDFWLRAAASFRMVPLRRDLYIYRRHATTLSAQRFPEILRKRETTLTRNLPSLKWLPLQAAVAGWINIAVMARRRRNYVAMLFALFRAFVFSPRDTIKLLWYVINHGAFFIYRLEFAEQG